MNSAAASPRLPAPSASESAAAYAFARSAAVDTEGRFVEGELGDRWNAGCGRDDQRTAGRHAVDESPSAGRVDEGGKVVDLALYGAGTPVAARSAAAAIIGVHGETPGQEPRQRDARRQRIHVVECPADEDQRRA